MRTSFAEASENAFSRMDPRRARRTLPNASGTRCGSCQARFWRVLGISRTLLGVSWASLGRSWALLGRLLGALGRLLPCLGRLWGASSLSGTPLTSILGASEANSEGPGAPACGCIPFHLIPFHCHFTSRLSEVPGFQNSGVGCFRDTDLPVSQPRASNRPRRDARSVNNFTDDLFGFDGQLYAI